MHVLELCTTHQENTVKDHLAVGAGVEEEAREGFMN